MATSHCPAGSAGHAGARGGPHSAGARWLRPPSARWLPGPRGATTTVAVAVVGCLTAIGTAVGIWVIPGLVDVGFLGWMPFPLLVRVLLHLPPATALMAGILVAMPAIGALRLWWSRPIRLPAAALALALTAFARHPTLWHLVGLQI